MVFGVVRLFYALLQLKHYRTCGIYDFYSVLVGDMVRFRRLAVRAEQHLHVVEAVQVVVGDGYKPFVLQSVNFVGIVHDIAEAVELSAFVELLLRFSDGCDHTWAEA